MMNWWGEVSETALRSVWREVQELPEAAGRKVFLDLGGDNYYANIRHEKGYVVWYMPGHTPIEAMMNLRDALNERRSHEKDYA